MYRKEKCEVCSKRRVHSKKRRDSMLGKLEFPGKNCEVYSQRRGTFPVKVRELIWRQRRGSRKELWLLFSSRRGASPTCVLHILVNSDATLCIKGVIVLLSGASVLYSTGSFSIVEKRGGKLWSFISFLVMSPLSRHASEIFEGLFLTSPCLLSSTVDGVLPDVHSHQSRCRSATLWMKGHYCPFCAASLLLPSKLFPVVKNKSWEWNLITFFVFLSSLSKHGSPVMRTSYGLGTYRFFAARVRWCGHFGKGIRENKTLL